MKLTASRIVQVGVLAGTVTILLILCCGAIGIGFGGDPPLLVQCLMAGVCFLVLSVFLAAGWFGSRKKGVN